MNLRLLAFLLATTFLAQGCDSSDPDPVLGGRYLATELAAGSDDLLAAGGSLEMTLQDGSVSGTFVIPDEFNEPGEPDTVDLAGTYTVSGTTVRFTQTADTFVRDAVWTFADGALTTTFGPLRARLETP